MRSCQAGASGSGNWSGSGVDDWLCMNDGCSSTHWYTYTLGCPSNFFLYERQGEGGGGESKQILREYGFKKNFENYGRPLRFFSKLHCCNSFHRVFYFLQFLFHQSFFTQRKTGFYFASNGLEIFCFFAKAYEFFSPANIGTSTRSTPQNGNLSCVHAGGYFT